MEGPGDLEAKASRLLPVRGPMLDRPAVAVAAKSAYLGAAFEDLRRGPAAFHAGASTCASGAAKVLEEVRGVFGPRVDPYVGAVVVAYRTASEKSTAVEVDHLPSACRASFASSLVGPFLADRRATCEAGLAVRTAARAAVPVAGEGPGP